MALTMAAINNEIYCIRDRYVHDKVSNICKKYIGSIKKIRRHKSSQLAPIEVIFVTVSSGPLFL